MPNLKQRLIKAGTSFNYSEGMKVKATLAISANQIVFANGYDGPFVTVALADASAAGTCSGRLMIAKHDIPINEYGVVLPWKLVTGIDTSAASAAGVPVFLSDTAGGWGVGAGTVSVIIGNVLTDHASTGGILFCTDMGKT